MENPPIPLPTERQVDRALVKLSRALGASKVLTEAEACGVYARDESEAEGRAPQAVVLASTKDDIQKALAVARETEVPITPRSGGTGRAGGAVPMAGGIVLSTLGMNQILDIDRQELSCVVEPGVVLGDLHHAVEAEGLFYPPDANSLSSCTLGGNVACNAGGPRAFKYGVTGAYVLGVETFLIGGQAMFAGRRTRKGVTGYDVTSLLVGSEGTLGLFGNITLKLIRRPESVMTLLALFRDVEAAAQGVLNIVADGAEPTCIEMLDAGTLQALRAAGNPIDADAGALLLMDVDGSEADVERVVERLGSLLDDSGATNVLAAQDAGQRHRLWAARRDMSRAVRRMARHKLSEDVVVPRTRIAALLELVRRLSETHQVRMLTYGHAGDGNFHVNFIWDEPDEKLRVDAAIAGLMRGVVALSGTLSGEHGIGVLKAPFLPLEQSGELIALQRDIKRVFDPQGLLNPGKIFPTRGHGSC